MTLVSSFPKLGPQSFEFSFKYLETLARAGRRPPAPPGLAELGLGHQARVRVLSLVPSFPKLGSRSFEFSFEFLETLAQAGLGRPAPWPGRGGPGWPAPGPRRVLSLVSSFPKLGPQSFEFSFEFLETLAWAGLGSPGVARPSKAGAAQAEPEPGHSQSQTSSRQASPR